MDRLLKTACMLIQVILVVVLRNPQLEFTMELSINNKIPFLGMNIWKVNNMLETSVYRKPTNTGLLLHALS